jgi:hypothetical protein
MYRFMDFNFYFLQIVKRKLGIYDDGESIVDVLDVAHTRRLGVTRQSVIKMWLSERLQQNQ